MKKLEQDLTGILTFKDISLIFNVPGNLNILSGIETALTGSRFITTVRRIILSVLVHRTLRLGLALEVLES